MKCVTSGNKTGSSQKRVSFIRHNIAKILHEDREEFGSTGTCHRFVSRRLVVDIRGHLHQNHRQVDG
ncbi:MAG: hypothetical protein K940chlam7_01983 [Chlamydiae bacterium]|nr:hypothetical protein [Chlamydiota bacterium]